MKVNGRPRSFGPARFSLTMTLKWGKDAFLDLSGCFILPVLCSRFPGAHSISRLGWVSAQNHGGARLSFTFFRDNHGLVEGKHTYKIKDTNKSGTEYKSINNYCNLDYSSSKETWTYRNLKFLGP